MQLSYKGNATGCKVLVYWTAQQRHALLSDYSVVFLYRYGTWSDLVHVCVYSDYLHVNDWSKHMSGMFMQSHVTSCKVMQSHVKSYKVCKVSRQVKSRTCSVNFTLLSQRFTCIQAFSGSWREVVVYHRWSLEFRLVFLCCFFRKQTWTKLDHIPRQ